MAKRSPSNESGSDDGYNSDREMQREKLRLINRDTLEFKRKYNVLELLNNSANGVIYSGVRIEDGESVVIKQVSKTKIHDYVLVDGRPVPKEFHIHRLASNIRGVVKAFEWFERRTTWVLVMEKPSNCIDIFEFSSRYGSVTESSARTIISNVISSCAAMYDERVFHRDIKDENVLLNPTTLETFIIDFGCAAEATNQHQEFRSFSGTPEFTCPEYYITGRYEQEKSTVWSIGCLLYVLLFGDIPFEDMEQITRGDRYKFDESVLSTEMKSILNSMFQMNPSNRATFSDLLQNQWLFMKSEE